MDKKLKLKTELTKKLKQEMSSTGTGASVTPGAGEGVATKYAFGKRKNKGTPSDWKSAPSIPNRPSKAMDYKELWEIKRDQEVKITSGQYAGNTAVVHDFDSEKDIASNDDWVDVLIGSKKEKKTVKASDLKPLKEGELNKIHIGTDTKTDSDIYFEPSTGTFSINVIDAAGNRWNKLQVNTIDDVLAKFPNWKWTKEGEMEFQPEEQDDDEDDYDWFINTYVSEENLGENSNQLQEAGEYDSLAGILKQLGAEEDSVKVLLKAVEMGALKPSEAVTIVKKALGVKEEIQEGYAQFRNATKTRSKPDQFHQAVKEIKRKMSEINRIFEYVDRLKTELSEGEDLKYKKYTENAFQQIKESAKQLFFKSTKLK